MGLAVPLDLTRSRGWSCPRRCKNVPAAEPAIDRALPTARDPAAPCSQTDSQPRSSALALGHTPAQWHDSEKRCDRWSSWREICRNLLLSRKHSTPPHPQSSYSCREYFPNRYRDGFECKEN